MPKGYQRKVDHIKTDTQLGHSYAAYQKDAFKEKLSKLNDKWDYFAHVNRKGWYKVDNS